MSLRVYMCSKMRLEGMDYKADEMLRTDYSSSSGGPVCMFEGALMASGLI